MLRDLSWLNVLVTFPGILYVGILGGIVALQLDMGGSPDIIPVFTGELIFLEAFYGISIVACIVELPDSV